MDDPSPEAFREALAEPSGARSEPVDPQPVAPAAEPAPPQPPDPPPESPDPRATRRYMPHAFNIGLNDRRVEGTYYLRDQQTVDIEGTYGADSFDSIEGLINLARLTNDQRDAFLSKTTTFLTMARNDRNPFVR